MLFGKRIAGIMTVLSCVTLLGAGGSANEAVMQNGIKIGGVDVSGMTYEQALSAVKNKVAEYQNDDLTVFIGNESVNTKAADLGLIWENTGVVEEAFALGNSGNIVDRYKESVETQSGGKEFDIKLAANRTLIRYFINEECMQYESDPLEASISADGSGGIDLVVGEDGLTINVDESIELVADYLENKLENNGSIPLSVNIEPIASKEDVESITDCLGTYTTYYGSTYDRNVNVERGAELINGHLIKPGESFSVCDHLVPFSPENGYELAGAYSDGQVVQEYGGGICQVSTTLYNALLLAELEIVERHNHTMPVDYVPTSMDAAIAEGNMDLVFRNNLDTPIFLSGYAAGGELTFTVWGKETRPKDRYVSYYSETTGVVPGYNASPGSTAVLYKEVTYNGETTYEVVNESTYDPIPAATPATGYIDPVTGLWVDPSAGAATGTTGYIDPVTGAWVDPAAGIYGTGVTPYTDPTAAYTDPSVYGYTY